MQALFGDNLLGKSGTVKTSDALVGKVTGLYFSAHWCPPCKRFTPVLAELYEKIKAEHPFEIVFVSSDNDQAQFEEYYGSMPWLALPYDALDEKNALSRKFKVSGIPTLVIVDAEGNTITTDGNSAVTEDPDGFPWTPKSVPELLGTTLRKPDGTTVGVDALDGKVLGLYFSAHWCPPCKMFTPELAKIYSKLQADGKQFEIVFVSSDQDEGQFNEYHGSMPWLALPFADRGSKAALSRRFGVEGIPSLVILGDDANRTLINGKARGAVTDIASFPWHPKPIDDMNESPDGLNEEMCVVAFLEGCDDSEQEEALKALEMVAKARKEAGESTGFLYATSDGPISTQVRALTKLGHPKADASLVIIDIPSDGVFYLSPAKEVTVDTVNALLETVKSGAAERKQLQR